MAASLGTAVHASIEDLLQIDLKGKDPTETHWLPDMAEKFLRSRWQEEKEIFLATPRRPSWKEKDWDKAKKMQRGAIKILLEFIGASEITPLKTTVQIWKILLSRVIAVEGELRTQDNRLMGRLDMLFADVDSSGKLQGWVVADLKTGRAPDNQLKPEVQRQLLLYRDILLSNNPNAPPVKTEGWYTANSKRYTASGDSVWRMHSRHGKQPNLVQNLLKRSQGKIRAEGSVIGKHGALIGGHGDWKMALLEMKTFQIQ